jgi:hypothetical protein
MLAASNESVSTAAMPSRRRIFLLTTRLALILSVAFVFSALRPNCPAAIIIVDNFTAADNTALLGRLPSPTDAPGTPYAGNGNVSTVGGFTGGAPYEADIQSNMARVGADAAVAVNLNMASAAQFQLSIDFNINSQTETQANNIHRGAGLGFFSSVALGSSGASHGFNNFTGLTIDRTGSVRLIIGGADSGIFTTVSGFDPSITHNLSYQVNTAAGAGTISKILLAGSAVSLTAAVNTFTIARTVYAGFYNSSGPTTELSNYDNFFVATVPETSTLIAVPALAAAVCAGAFFRRRRMPI